MKKSVLGLMAAMAAVLASCAPATPPVVETTIGDRQDVETLPSNFSMLDIGRALSKGSVDIYDPWLPTLTVPAVDFAVVDPSASFPVHPFMLVRDERVRVFSLASDGVDETSSFMNVLNDVENTQHVTELAPPVPLVEEEPLKP